MKKHPVDDLFKKRLTSLEKKPSELAWKRIKEGQKNKSRRMAAWIWYAAAGISLTMLTGYLVWQNRDNTASPVHQSGEIAKMDEAAPEAGQTADPVDNQSQADVRETLKAVPNKQAPKVADNKTSERPDKRPVPAHRADERSIEEPDAVQIARTLTPKAQDTETEKADIPQVTPEKAIPKPIALARREEDKADRTIIVEVEEPASELQEPSKPSRFARVFRQLKNVREAEPVDWEDVGFNPKRIIARADDRSEEKVSGKHERKN